MGVGLWHARTRPASQNSGSLFRSTNLGTNAIGGRTLRDASAAYLLSFVVSFRSSDWPGVKTCGLSTISRAHPSILPDQDDLSPAPGADVKSRSNWIGPRNQFCRQISQFVVSGAADVVLV